MIIGVDTGGTFTDFVVVDKDEIRIHKVPSTPEDPSQAVLQGLTELLGDGGRSDSEIIHGSTVATNSLLERKGATVALLTTAGFEDVIEIGRQTRREIYDLTVTKPEPLVPSGRRFGIEERLDEHGTVLVALEKTGNAGQSVATAVRKVIESGAEAVAICLLHSYANPDHERLLADAVRSIESPLPLFVTASHEVLPEFREYERISTTAVNAFVGPVMSRYLTTLGQQLGSDRVRIMASNGGVVSLDTASRLAVQTILSGPAGGAVGGFEIARMAGYDHVITFDMGGTSTDVSLCAGGLTHTSEAEIGGLPIRVPVIDIHTVGAGGGSIASRDPGGSLRVGPNSAGADPGPICYGQGGKNVTVTDANLFLGRLSPEHFLGGAKKLLPEGVEPIVSRFADELGLEPVVAAEGVVRVANATMERAIRVISLERGFDPRDFSLLCFGGAGGLHAVDLARSLGIPRVIVPRGAGTLSALGMLMAEPIRDFSRTLMVPADRLEAGTLEAEFAALEEQGRHALAVEGFPDSSLRFERLADLRYVGQGFELAVAANPDGPEKTFSEGTHWKDWLIFAFHAAHEQRYGYADATRPTEIVTIRVRAIASRDTTPELRTETIGDPDATAAAIETQTFMYGGVPCTGVLFDRDRLRPGHTFEGPAIVVEYSTTTLVPPGVECQVDEWGSLVLETS
jgi:N-methylhydantoinase A